MNIGSFTRKVLPLLMLAMVTTLSVWAQSRTVSGTVTSFAGDETIPGVAVRIKGTSTGTVTDLDGKYQIQVPSGEAVLVFSFIGYNDEEAIVGTRTTIDVKLTENIETLGEVVVVGYGTQEKREVTGSIAKVDGSKIAQMPTPSFESALQGRAAGVQVIQGSGMAGSGAVIKVRGTSTISANGDPLYVVDGVPITQDNFLGGNRGAMNQNPLATINPEDIESVEILKDAGSAAIYGSRGANGVILVTTKRGKAGKGKFNFSTEQGFSRPTIKPEFLNTQEWIQLRQEAWENDGNTGPVWLPGYTTAGATVAERQAAIDEASQINTDWWDEAVRTGHIQEYNLSYSKGTKRLNTFISGSYSDNDSYLKGNSYERLSGRINLDANITNNLKAALTSSISRGLNNRVDAAWAGGLGAAMSTALPYYPVYNADGSYSNRFQNIVQNRELLDWRARELRTINNLSFTYTPIDNLNLKAVGSYDYMDTNDDTFSPPALDQVNNGSVNRNKSFVSNYILSLQADYTLQLENSKLTALLGSEYQESTTESRRFNKLGVDQPIYEMDEIGDDFTRSGDPTNIMRFFSYFGRAVYNIKDRYILQGIARVDASSAFGPDYQYGFFPSISAAWIMSEENFLKDIEQLSMLKFRASYGLIGSAPPEANLYRGRFQIANTIPYRPGEEVIYPRIRPNPSLKWQSTYNTDLGLEFGLFGNRITGELGYYNRITEDVIVNRSLPLSTGFDDYWDNVGKIRNTGLEFDFTSRNIVGDFTWTTNFNIAHNTNKVLSLGDLTPDAAGGGTNDTRVAEGYPVGTNYLVRYVGVDAADGLPIWLDANGYQTKEFSLDHRVFVGDVLPDFTGGINNSFTYKGFDLSFLFTFTKGGNIYDGSAKRQLGVVSDWNMRSEIADRWTGPGDTDARFPRLTMELYPGLPDVWQYNSTMFLYDASFVRLRTLSLGYNLPGSVASKIKASSLRVYVSGMNLLTFSEFPGDPEIARDFENPQDRNLSPNVTYLTTPQQKSVTLGINVTF